MSVKPAGNIEPFTISELDLTDSVRLSNSIREVHYDLESILTFFAKNARTTPKESTHQIRKKLKFFRAFVKLLKPYNTDENVRRVNFLLRDFGRLFSGMRDAHVRAILIEEFQNLPALNKSQSSLQFLADTIQEEIRQMETGMFEPDNVFERFANELEGNLIVNQYLNIVDPDPESILESFRNCFEKSAFSYQLAFDTGEADHMHEWRKRLKDVQYQFELLLMNLPESLIYTYHPVVILCDHLGRYNDLDMFHHWLDHAQKGDRDAQYSDLTSSLISLTDQIYTEVERLGMDLYGKSLFE